MDFNFKAAGIRTRRKRKIDAKNFALYETSAFLESRSGAIHHSCTQARAHRWNKSVLAPLDGSKWKSSLALVRARGYHRILSHFHRHRVL
mmetsp:Transcript_22344/g.68964  ORF Transcript_22344/g.68964 Transcript_22344/m.68964 type:complete len:90 (-) Transcript_22344:509-778(-)